MKKEKDLIKHKCAMFDTSNVWIMKIIKMGISSIREAKQGWENEEKQRNEETQLWH